jgi:integrase
MRQISKEELMLTGEPYRNFVCSVKSRYTAESYTKALRQFMVFKKLYSCEDLLKQDSRILQSNIIDWLIHLKEEKGLSSASMTLYSAAIRHFYEMNDVLGLNWKKINSFIGEQVRTVKDRPYTREEIARMLDYANDKRLKIAILLMCTAGLRIGAISALKIQNLVRIPKYEIYQITIYENTREEYVSFCSKECSSVIDSYLKLRKIKGETIRPQSPLLREEFDNRDRFKISHPRAISTTSLRARIFRLLACCGMRENRDIAENVGVETRRNRYQRHETMQCHGMRKFFSTTATKYGLNPLYVELLMGHKIPGVTASYFKPSTTDLLEGNDKMLGYVSVMNSLTINDENRLRLEVERLSTIAKDNECVINNKLKDTYDEIQHLRIQESNSADVIAALSDRVDELSEKLSLLNKKT